MLSIFRNGLGVLMIVAIIRWWEFLKRPQVKQEELSKLQSLCQKTEAIAFMISSRRNLKVGSNSIEGVEVMASSL